MDISDAIHWAWGTSWLPVAQPQSYNVGLLENLGWSQNTSLTLSCDVLYGFEGATSFPWLAINSIVQVRKLSLPYPHHRFYEDKVELNQLSWTSINKWYSDVSIEYREGS